MRVGVAGLGKMGAAIAARLMECGHDVIVWNRSADKAKPLADAGRDRGDVARRSCRAGGGDRHHSNRCRRDRCGVSTARPVCCRAT